MNQVNWESCLQHFLMIFKNGTVQMVLFLHLLRLSRHNIAQRNYPATLRKGQKTLNM